MFQFLSKSDTYTKTYAHIITRCLSEQNTYLNKSCGGIMKHKFRAQYNFAVCLKVFETIKPKGGNSRTVTLCVHFLHCLSCTARQKFTPVYNKGNIICSYTLIFCVYVGNKEDNSETDTNQVWKWAYTRTDVVYLVPGCAF